MQSNPSHLFPPKVISSLNFRFITSLSFCLLLHICIPKQYFLLWFVMTFIKMVLVRCNFLKFDFVIQVCLTIHVCSWSSFIFNAVWYSILWFYHSLFNCPHSSELPWMFLKYLLGYICQFFWTVFPHLFTSWHCQTLHWPETGIRTAAALAPLNNPMAHLWLLFDTLSTDTHSLKPLLSDIICLVKEFPGLRMQERLTSQGGFPK